MLSSQANFDAIRLERFKELCRMYEINDTFALKLRNLEGYEIIIICDDSGSMNTPVTIPGSNPYGNLPTRWDELKYTVGIIVDIAAVMDDNGVDIYFLNRPPLLNILYKEQLEPAFNIKATGGTPIVPILRSVLRKPCEKKRLIILATDGCPDSADGMDGVAAFRKVLEYERKPTDGTTILACTDDDCVMAYLNNWDKELPRLDIIDDYRSETIELKKVQGPEFPFSFGDYVVKVLMGGVDPWFDNLDEVCVTGYNTNTINAHPTVPVYQSTTGEQYRLKKIKNKKSGCILF